MRDGPLKLRPTAAMIAWLLHLSAGVIAAFAQAPPPPPPEGIFKTLLKEVTLGGQARVRAEYRDPTGYATAGQLDEDDDQILSRLRLNLKLAVEDNIDVFIQPQDSRVFGEEASVASNEKNLDLHQGWIEVRKINDWPLSVRVGRQELQYGDQRLVSPLDWSNTGRAWDGARIRYAAETFWVEGFYTVVKEGNGAEDDQDFYGIYASCSAVENHEFDLYVLARRFADNTFTDELGNTGDLKDVTFGARGRGKAGPWDYSGEIVLQRGDYVDTDIDALAFAATLGFTFDLPGAPRLGAEVTYASGDEDPADGDRETFDPLFPFLHAYQGYADVFAWKNGIDYAVYFKIAPAEGLSAHLDVHAFFLEEDRDAWYAASGSAIRRDATGAADDDVGVEVDLHAKYAWGKHVKFWGGVSRFFAGGFVHDTGLDPDMNWFFLQMVVDF